MSNSDCEYQLQPSMSYVSFSVLLHSGAMMSLWWAGLNLELSIPLTAVVLLGLILDLRGTGLRRASGAVAGISVRNGAFSLIHNNGSTSGPAHIRSGWALGCAVLLRVGFSSCRRATVVVPADALSPDSFRHLRIAVGDALDTVEAD